MLHIQRTDKERTHVEEKSKLELCRSLIPCYVFNPPTDGPRLVKKRGVTSLRSGEATVKTFRLSPPTILISAALCVETRDKTP